MRTVSVETARIEEEEFQLARLRERIAPLRREVNSHPLYGDICSLQDLRIFMESHVFAVWDFMSLLKFLQQSLTCVSVPWIPSSFPMCRRLVNDIVLGEESDTVAGGYLSHFELYHRAMMEAKADVAPIETFLIEVFSGSSVSDSLLSAGVPEEARRFVETTFSFIEQGKPHVVASAFTFGREDVIPDMFRSMVAGLSRQFPEHVATFHYYLQRHIEVDGESHGPMSLRMISELCGDDQTRWEECAQAAELALNSRIALWSGIRDRIRQSRGSALVAH
jgi:hypothetical protein